MAATTTVNALSDSLPSTVPSLQSSGKNWAIFELRFTSAVDSKGRWGHFDGTSKRPEAVDAKDDEKEWLKNEASARNLLLSKVPDSIALKMRKHKTVADAWKSLEAEFTEKSGYAQTDLRQDFLDATCAEKGNVRQFLESLSSKKEELAAVGVEIDDTDYRSTILRGIPLHYSDFASSVLSTAKLMRTDPTQSITPDALATAISEEYDRKERSKARAKGQGNNGKRKPDEVDDTLAVTNSAWGGQKSKTDRTCWKCGKKGHLKKDCRSKGKAPVSGQGSGGTANVVESDSDWEAGGAFGVEDGDSLPDLTSVSTSIWSDSGVSVDQTNESNEDCILFSDMEEEEIVPDLPDGLEEDWSDVQLFRSSDLERVISLESDVSSEPVAIAANQQDVPSSTRSELYDTGCSRHISPYRNDFANFKSIPPKSFRAANCYESIMCYIYCQSDVNPRLTLLPLVERYSWLRLVA
ncbi:hypothetical protein D9757_013036 [Collybiopsis confluens]|uniref:CCHC-type domain-containing protein n=1 Tax=Collybiopsis confluens TaxID=2823264 RepID=A0A8H5GHG6_9AGAR|nr:hypothetical protein D9757_013036 [Collybiopsis confluens]